MTSVVPPGTARVHIGQASAVGTIRVRSYAEGELLGTHIVETTPGTGGTVVLPKGADFVEVTPDRTSVHVALLVSGRVGQSTGATVLPLVPVPTERLVPNVRPGR
jgi:hypothetical protein